jgi:hypothetical protein
VVIDETLREKVDEEKRENRSRIVGKSGEDRQK